MTESHTTPADPVENALFRIAICAFTHDPADPDTDVAADADWCVQPLRFLPDAERDDLRAAVVEQITSPAADRRSFLRRLAAYTPAGGEPRDRSWGRQ